GAIRAGDSRGAAATGVHADGERGAERRGVVVDHHGDLQLVEPLRKHGHAHEAAPVHDHEVDGLGRRLVSCHEEVALVLAVLVVHHDENPPRANFLHRLFNPRELALTLDGHRDSSLTLNALSTYLPITSISRFPRRPGFRRPRVVHSSVCGMTMTSKAPLSSEATVRLTPSTATDPLGMRSGASAASCHSTLMRAVSPSVSTAAPRTRPSPCPRTRWPPTKPLSRMGRSRLT